MPIYGKPSSATWETTQLRRHSALNGSRLICGGIKFAASPMRALLMVPIWRNARPLLAVLFGDHQRGSGGVGGQHFETFDRPQYINGGRQAVGNEAGGGDDRDTGASGDWLAGAGIKDV